MIDDAVVPDAEESRRSHMADPHNLAYSPILAVKAIIIS